MKTVARRAVGRPRKDDRILAEQSRVTIGTVKGSREFSDWARALAKRERLSISLLLEHALVSYAREKGFEEPPNR